MDQYHKIYLKFVLDGATNHVAKSKIIAAFVYDIENKIKKTYNFCHPDLTPNGDVESFLKSIKNTIIFVNNKKSYRYFLKKHKLIDVNLFDFIEKNELEDEIVSGQYTVLYNRSHELNNFHKIVPLTIHQSIFDKEVESFKDKFELETDSYCFKFFNDVISETLFVVENNGLKVNEEIFKNHFKSKTYDGFVYSQYYIYNPTGRPSNRFDGVNYAALNKEDGCRNSFVSRYGDDGFLFMIDFTGFHPYIVSNLIDYKVPDEETIYEHLAKQYYNVDVVDSETMGKAKKLTMVNLYGQIKDQYLSIPFFAKTDELKNKYWSLFEKNGYVMTPLYKRKITNKHITDPNKNKLFAYIIQAAETEYGLDSLGKVIKFVSDKDIVPIMYVYDSIVLDVDKNTDKQTILDLIDIIKNKRFKVKVYSGNNYHDLKLQQF